MKLKIQIRVQATRVLVAVLDASHHAASYVCPDESFHDLEFSFLVGLGDGVHEVECDLRKASRRKRVDCGAGAPVADEVGWLEFGWNVGVLTTDDTIARILSLCAERGVSQVLPVVPERLAAELHRWVRELPLDGTGEWLGYPEITDDLIKQILVYVGPGD